MYGLYSGNGGGATMLCFGKARFSGGGPGSGASEPGGESFKKSAIWRRMVEFRGPLSCWTAEIKIIFVYIFLETYLVLLVGVED